MKKTMNIHLGRQLFVIEEDAYDVLQQYLKRLELSLRGEEGIEEIIEDIEMRFAELIVTYLGSQRKVIELADIQAGIASLGEPEVIGEDTANEEKTSNYSTNESNSTAAPKRLYRDGDNGLLGGVAAGIAAYLNLDPVIVRILFIVLCFTGFGVPLYIILWVIVPNALTPSERLQMQGKPVTVEALKEEFLNAADRIKGDTLRARDRFQSGNERFISNSRRLTLLVGRIFGIGILIMSFCWLVFFALSVTGLIEFIPTSGDQSYSSIHDFLHLAIPVDGTFNLIWTAILLIGTSLCILTLLTGIRLLLQRNHSFLRINFIIFPILLVIGICFAIVGGVQISRDFAVYAEVEQQHFTTNVAHLNVKELPVYSGKKRIVSTGGIDFMDISKGSIGQQGIELSYRPSKDSLYHIIQIQRAHGIDRSSALKRSSRINHHIKLVGEDLLISPEYRFPLVDGLRDQDVEIIIEVPTNKTLSVNSLDQETGTVKRSGNFYSNSHFEVWEDWD